MKHIKTKRDTKRELRNCLLITIDTLRADHLGCYGYSDIKSPVIDRLADEGVLFQQAFTPVPITLPSHASIMTGLYPEVHGVKDNGIYKLEDSFLTLAEILHAQGYFCAAFVGSFILNSRFGLSQGFDIYNDQMASADLKSASLYQERRAEMVTHDVLNFFHHHTSEPFFVWAHYFDPHIPYDPPDPFLRDYRDSLYDGEIAYTDFFIGKILECLEKKNQLNNTLIIVMSDHGEGLGEHGERTHGIFIYDSTLHVPVIMRCPKILPKGRKIIQQVRTIDLFPTILDLLTLRSIKVDCNGKTLIPHIFGSQSNGNILYCSTDYPFLGFGWAPLKGIRIEGWKYIEAPKSELYQIKKNPMETKNLIFTQSKKAESLSAKLKDIKRRLSDYAPQINPIPLDSLTQQRLLSLGYVSPGVQSPGINTVNVKNLPDPKDKISIVTDIDISMSEYLNCNFDAAVKRLKSVFLEDPDNLLGNFYWAQFTRKERSLPKRTKPSEGLPI